MPRLSKQVIIEHRADEVFDLVADVRRYPDFIKWIRSMKVSGEREENGVRKYRGEVDVGFKGFSERFATDITADQPNNTVEVKLAYGPFKRLQNRWKMTPDGQLGTVIDFFIDYEFRNPVLSFLAKANTSLAVNKIMKSFIEEADRRYGARRT
ncbi:type II toxin-antitoxin system RatA family toxin [Henriciella marina]|uniref:type II toxin-antitoxin system RatA family toxin n=1 Tax=Henriciella marina TaxID=453851 RepID=UPI00035DE853|nr:SRPBCC family protein [Henriciella marina]